MPGISHAGRAGRAGGVEASGLVGGSTRVAASTSSRSRSRVSTIALKFWEGPGGWSGGSWRRGGVGTRWGEYTSGGVDILTQPLQGLHNRTEVLGPAGR